MAKMRELSVRERRAVIALLSASTVTAAADSSGISETTIRRYMQDETFAAELRAARHDAYRNALDSLKAAAVEAVTTLRNVMGDDTATATARVSAARAVLELARAADMDELDARISELERLSGATPGPRGVVNGGKRA